MGGQTLRPPIGRITWTCVRPQGSECVRACLDASHGMPFAPHNSPYAEHSLSRHHLPFPSFEGHCLLCIRHSVTQVAPPSNSCHQQEHPVKRPHLSIQLLRSNCNKVAAYRFWQRHGLKSEQLNIKICKMIFAQMGCCMQTGSKKQPYYINFGEGGLMRMAGLYDCWYQAEGEPMYSYTILTTDSNKQLSW